MRRTGTTRRGALKAVGATAGGLLTACSGGDDDGADEPGTAAAVRAEKALRVRSTRTSRELLRQYDAVLELHPDQATRLTPLRDSVALHVTALSPPPPKKKDESGKPKPSPSESASASAPPDGAPVGDVGGAGPTPFVPADPGKAVRELAAAERRSADAHAEALVQAPPELARLLASLAAAGAAHAYLLTKGSSS
ncbi:hypothetical protein [Streptomyces sp. 4R-3d]|uniref:hypothetical protein n=1 Tax=Streptomyces sp. 4R-3d TaxID=2559605 RepID=UPI001072F982|nr:hypothetical protein [Streptomyces sp. 4R-3d]TFI20563.1 hypothetical protein E4P36_36065 [Streptomyces sp. 4R-3d]